MALATFSRPAPFGAITVFNLVARAEQITDKLRDWNNRRLTHNALAGLSDRQLEDIGLSRGDLDALPPRF